MAGTIEAKLKGSTEKTKKARRNAGDAPGRKTTGKASLRKSAETGSKKVAKTSRKVETAGEAEEESLRAAASKAVDRNKEHLARHLLSETLHGNARSAKLLLSLTEPKDGHEDEEQERPPESLALLLESEPEWRDEQSEAVSETGGGGLEPER